MNTVLRTITGKRYFGAGAEFKEEEEPRQFLKTLKEFVRLLGLFVVGDALPCLLWLDLGRRKKALKKSARKLDSILDEWLEEHRWKRASGHHTGDQDFMDVMLSVIDGLKLGGYDADTISKAPRLGF